MVQEIKSQPESFPIPEQSGIPEQANEGVGEGTGEAMGVSGQEQPSEAAAPVVTTASLPAAPALGKEADVVAIESILSDGLEEIYRAMPVAAQLRFKAKGEETAGKIAQLIATAKATAHRVIALIRAWLAVIPGVSKFFLEQDAKIKTDKILARADDQKNQ